MTDTVATNVQWIPLHYGQPQITIALVFAALALGLAGLFTVVALQTQLCAEPCGPAAT